MREKKWVPFPHSSAAIRYDGKALATRWSRLHRGDCEPFPSMESLASRLRDDVAISAKEIAVRVQEAWREFHAGDFYQAHETGKELGLPGFAVAVKAAGVYASYLESNDHHAQELLLSASQQAERAMAEVPHDPNAHYLYAFALGRYSQRLSVLEALARGLAPKIERALQQTLKLEQKHADAHIALGLYHAEIIGKLGALAGGLSYGVSARSSVEHFNKAIKLNPDAPTAKLEYAHALRLIDGEANADQIDTLLDQAAHAKPLDAMEVLDVKRAKELLEKA